MNNYLEIKKLSKSYRNQKKISVLKNLNYKFKKGKIYSLVGPSDSPFGTIISMFLEYLP